jgi:hypothetical protein
MTTVKAIGLCGIFTSTRHWLSDILRANLGSGLAMQGPGVRSVDAQLFAVKRLNIPNG